MKHIIIPAIIFTILYFLGSYVALKGILNTFNISFSKFWYLFPLYIILIFGTILIITILINESLFCFFFYFIRILYWNFYKFIFHFNNLFINNSYIKHTIFNRINNYNINTFNFFNIWFYKCKNNKNRQCKSKISKF